MRNPQTSTSRAIQSRSIQVPLHQLSRLRQHHVVGPILTVGQVAPPVRVYLKFLDSRTRCKQPPARKSQDVVHIIEHPPLRGAVWCDPNYTRVQVSAIRKRIHQKLLPHYCEWKLSRGTGLGAKHKSSIASSRAPIKVVVLHLLARRGIQKPW